MSREKILTMLGFGERSRKIVSGETGCRIAIQKKKAKLLIIASDASESKKTDFKSLATHHQVPILEFDYKETLGKAIGKSSRSAVAICDDALAETIDQLIE